MPTREFTIDVKVLVAKALDEKTSNFIAKWATGETEAVEAMRSDLMALIGSAGVYGRVSKESEGGGIE